MTRSPFAAIVTATVAALALAACGGPADPPPAPPVGTWANVPAEPPGQPSVVLAVVAYTDPPRITGRQAPACVARANGMLPDPACTPGSVGSTDANAVCVPRFSVQRRPSTYNTDPVKTAAMLAYRIPIADRKRVELDHLVPLELGGSNDVSNLWPQISDLSLVDEHNSKDQVENRIKLAVCRDQIPRAMCRDRGACLTIAQEALARDWTAAEKFLGLAPR